MAKKLLTIPFLETESPVRIKQICDLALEKNIKHDLVSDYVNDKIHGLVQRVIDGYINGMIYDKFRENEIWPSWVKNKLTSNSIYGMNISHLESLFKIAMIQKFSLSNSKSTAPQRAMIYNLYMKKINGDNPLSREIIRKSHARVLEDIDLFIRRIQSDIEFMSEYNVPIDIWRDETDEGYSKFGELALTVNNEFISAIEGAINENNKKSFSKRKLPSVIMGLIKSGQELSLVRESCAMVLEMIQKYDNRDIGFDIRYKYLCDRYVLLKNPDQFVEHKLSAILKDVSGYIERLSFLILDMINDENHDELLNENNGQSIFVKEKK